MAGKQLLLTCLQIISICAVACAQEFLPGPSIHCFESERKHPKTDGQIHQRQFQGQTEIGSVFNIDYEHLPLQARAPALHALNIWAGQLNTTVPINVEIGWRSFTNNALASAKATRLYKNLRNAEFPESWHVVALAEKLEGRHLNDRKDPDIMIEINEATNWYFGIDAHPPPDKMDLVTIILHEIAHGLGFLSSAQVSDTVGCFEEHGHRLLFDEFIYNGDNTLLHTLPSCSSTLYREFTSDQVFFHDPSDNLSIKLHAPAVFQPISSISHLDEWTYFIGSENSLMTPSFKTGEAIHSPGPSLRAILDRMGWSNDAGSLKVFVNPVDGTVTFQASPGMVVKKLIVFDSHGRQIKEVPLCCDTQIAFPSSGLFIVVAETNDGRLIKKFIIP